MPSWLGTVIRIGQANTTSKRVWHEFSANNLHAQVSDLIWEQNKPYEATTGAGAIGVEFAGTAVSSSGASGNILATRKAAEERVGNNTMLQWQDGYYRGYFILSVTPEKLTAQFYGKYL